MERRWLSVEEISSYVGVRRETIYRWIEGKAFPAHRVGRLWKFRTEEVDEWIIQESRKAKTRKPRKKIRRVKPVAFVGPKKGEILEIAKKHGAMKVKTFASTHHGEGKGGAHVAFLVEMEKGRTLLDLVALSKDLEALLGSEVDVTTEGGLSPNLRDRIKREAKPL